MESRLFLVLLVTVSLEAQQLQFKNCGSYSLINASNYDMNPSSSNPLGYHSNVLPYMDGQKVTPCMEVTSIPSTAYVEIKIETKTSGMKICVGDELSLRVCGQGKLSTCYSAPFTTVKFAFYCETACEQVDIPFWYRFVMSGENPSDQWCENRPSDDYPSSLFPVPTNLPKGTTTKIYDSASKGMGSYLLVWFSVHLSLVIMMAMN